MKKKNFYYLVMLMTLLTSCVNETPNLPSNDNNLSYLEKIFGDNIKVYSNEDVNPYGISLSNYGNNVKAIFYEPDLVNYEDEYKNVLTSSFYSNYIEANSFEDAYFRAYHNLMSGDITPQSHLPVEGTIKENDKYIRYSDAFYVLDYSGDYVAYIINSSSLEPKIIYYGAAYTSLEEVAAYLLAFGEVPVNSDYSSSKSGRNNSVNDWGEYGRCNIGEFYGNTSQFPHEPSLPGNSSGLYYIETDFGTKGDYQLKSYSKTYYQEEYNDGYSITRGAARFCFVSIESSKKIDDRYVFYTYNHYNDFQEYLNYYNGWGKRFGNESAGNYYCYNKNDYYASNKYPVTNYPETIIKERQ